MASLREFSLGRSRAHLQFSAAVLVVPPTSLGAIDFERNLAQPIAILAQFPLDGVAALSALTVLSLKPLHGLAAVAHFIGKSIELGIELSALPVECGKLAGQHHAQLGSQLFSELGVALGLGCLTLQRIQLPSYFVEDIVHPRQIQFRVFQTRFREPLFGFELSDPGCFLKNCAPVGGAAAQNLADASLFNERVGFRPEAGAHEKFLNVAQAAELAVEEIFAVA